jgi:N6-adenosine-specific RNA methylase IME4
MTELPINDIKIGPRFRKDVGDLASLQKSIDSIGLLHPPVVDGEGRLICGHRRVEACKALGWPTVPVRTVDLAEPLLAERDENFCREDFSPSEAVAVGEEIARRERAAAEERSRAGRSAGGRARHGNGSLGENCPQAERVRVRDVAARAVGMSPRTYEKALAVVEAGRSSPEQFAPLVELMDRTGNVDPAWRKLRRERLRERGASERSPCPGVLKDLPEGFGRYRCLYIDPPWRYEDDTCQGSAASHYETMSEEKIAALPVRRLFHPDGGHAWIWTTDPMVRDCVPHRVLEAWGLRWVGTVYWVKPGPGMGRWLRNRVEVLILAVPRQGPSVPVLDNGAGNVIEAARGQHSEKPKEAREYVERLSPEPRLELFARAAAEGWDRWGLEASL